MRHHFGEFMQTLAPVEQSKKELSRVDALEKVLGKTRYTTDMIDQEVLYLRIVRSPHAHATIKGMDVSAAEKVPGVVKVVTAKDVPGANEVGFFIQDQPLFCDKKVRFIGDAVAMVIAETPEAAELGTQAVKVDYESLPAVFEPEDALRDGAVKLHEKGNLLDHYFVKKGNVEEGFRQADIIIKGTYQTPIQEQAYLETEACVSLPHTGGHHRPRFTTVSLRSRESGQDSSWKSRTKCADSPRANRRSVWRKGGQRQTKFREPP